MVLVGAGIHIAAADEQALRAAEFAADFCKRLLEAFDTVNGHFQRLFKTLFGGGSAELTTSGNACAPSIGCR